jgi:hypothetical protein
MVKANKREESLPQPLKDEAVAKFDWSNHNPFLAEKRSRLPSITADENYNTGTNY